MNTPCTKREIEKPKTVTGKNALLRSRARSHGALLANSADALRGVGLDKLADIADVGANLLGELAEALKP